LARDDVAQLVDACIGEPAPAVPEIPGEVVGADLGGRLALGDRRREVLALAVTGGQAIGEAVDVLRPARTDEHRGQHRPQRQHHEQRLDGRQRRQRADHPREVGPDLSEPGHELNRPVHPRPLGARQAIVKRGALVGLKSDRAGDSQQTLALTARHELGHQQLALEPDRRDEPRACDDHRQPDEGRQRIGKTVPPTRDGGELAQRVGSQHHHGEGRKPRRDLKGELDQELAARAVPHHRHALPQQPRHLSQRARRRLVIADDERIHSNHLRAPAGRLRLHPELTLRATSRQRWDQDARGAVYSSSVTCSPHMTGLPLSSTCCMAMWVMNRSGAAPCQWSSAGSKKTRSPGRMTSTGPSRRWQKPRPSVTKIVCP
jgi:hypothetical protein